MENQQSDLKLPSNPFANWVETVELLAPAGSFESLQAAIQAGCDAVYFGVEQLNMRVRSSNLFRIEDLAQIAQVCKTHNIRSYITVNTIVYDHDIRLMESIIRAAKLAGIDAIIASDLAAIQCAFQTGIPVHISTQANVCNVETLSFFSPYADAVVLARELTLSQVHSIYREIERKQIKGPSGNLMRLEIFAHGALCMAISGKCYLSLHSHYASANRGACIQNCRRSYVVTDKEDGTELEIDNEYIMSAKDLCTIHFLDKILEAGVKIIKIEGRGRSVDYVYTVTSCYREALNALRDNSYHENRIAAWMKRLESVYNRGFWEGYYLGRTMGEWSDQYGSKATQRKVYIGRGVKYFDRLGVGEFVAESHTLETGNKVMIAGPTSGYAEWTIEQMMVDGKNVQAVKQGEVFTTPVPMKIRSSDKIYKLVSA